MFNLDPESDAQFDHVYDVLDQGGYEVVFNDGDASAQLSGWDQARWARHLAAKILHKPEMTEPPRPAWAESVPLPGRKPEAVAVAADTPVAPAPVPAPPPDPLPAMAVAELQLEPMTEEPAPQTSAAEVPTLEVPALDGPMLEGQMLEGFDLTDMEVDAGTTAQESAEAVAESNFASALEDFAAHVPAHQHSAPPAPEFVSELDALFGDARPGREAKSPAAEVASAMEDSSSLTLEPQERPGAFPAIFDQFDAAKASIPDAVDGSFRPAPLPSRDAEPATPALAEPLLPPDWSLEPLDEDTVVTPPQGKGSAFGIETMSATEFMTPSRTTRPSWRRRSRKACRSN